MTRLSRELFQVDVGDHTPRMWRPELVFLQAYDTQGAATRLSDPDFFAALPAGAQQRQYNLGVGGCVQPDHNVLENRHFAKELKVLVCPADTSPSPLVGTKSAHFCAVKHDLSG